MSLNYGKISDLLVFDLINRDNPGLPYPVDASNVIIEKITQVTPSAATNNRNTSARLRGQQQAGFRDTITVYYDRINIDRILPWWKLGSTTRTATAIVNFTAATTHELLPSFLDKYGINLQPKDIQNTSLPYANNPNQAYNYNISILATSPAYVGSSVGRLDRGLPVLDTSITIDVLSELNHPIPLSNQKCVDLHTYGIDFTAYKNMLTVNAAGLPNWAGLRAVLDSLGVPAYSAPLNSNYVSDVATSTAQYANKDFDRVVIQTGIDEAGAKGVAYYHYNN